MDHLPLPKHPVCQPPLVRLYENCAYDGGPLDNYLERRNTSERALVDLLLSDAADNLAAHGILQNWTFFGVICVTTGAPSAAVAQLRRKADSQWVVDTSRLPAFVHTWMSYVRAHNLPALQRRDMEARFVQFLNKMFAVYDKIEIMLKDRGRLDSMLRLSVALLYDYLYRASTFAFGPSDWVRPHLQVAAVDCMRPLLLQMTRNGWCEGEIQSTQTMCNLIDLWFVGFLDHPHPEKDHIGCTKSRCIAYQIDERDYRTKHTTDHCSCPYVYAAQDRLSSILLSSSEAVPVIRPGSLQTPKGRGGTAGCYVEVLSSHSAGHVLPYVAISHLWSDGLGNNQENAIPECQFRRLSNFVTELCGEPVCFWLDTLCFPLQPKEAYDVALIRMKETYEAASKVLVLDQSLTPVSAGGISREEIIARILVCPWNRRLWTLQEAQLSPTRELYFQFKEGAVSGLQLLQHIGAYGPLPDHQKFERSFAVNFYFTFQNLCGKKLKTESLRGVLTAKEALAFRSTSNAIDEGLCLGNLLGWDVKPLVDTIDRQERMRVFWDLVGQNTGTQHASVLFWPSPKLSVPGYRWAPATFMDADMDDVQLQPTALDGLVLGHSRLGLHVTLPVLEIKSFAMLDNKVHFLKIKGNPTRHFALTLQEPTKRSEIPWWDRLKISKTRRFLLFLPLPPRHNLLDDSSTTMVNVRLAAVSWRGSNRARLVTSGELTSLDHVSGALNSNLFPDEGPELHTARLSIVSKRVLLINDRDWYID